MKRLLIFTIAVCALVAQNRMTYSIVAQDTGHIALGLALRKLNVAGTFMQAPAHPDDETNALLAYYGLGMGMRSIDLQNNSGDGGQNEVTATWDMMGLPCKGRADRVLKEWLVDLKTTVSASPRGFQRAIMQWGHHLRAAFYRDGWALAQPDHEARDYLFVVVQPEPPHWVNTYRLEERALACGERLYKVGLRIVRDCQATDNWASWPPQTVGLPTWGEFALADMEATGALDPLP